MVKYNKYTEWLGCLQEGFGNHCKRKILIFTKYGVLFKNFPELYIYTLYLIPLALVLEQHVKLI